MGILLCVLLILPCSVSITYGFLMSKDGETKPSILKLGARHIFVDNH